MFPFRSCLLLVAVGGFCFHGGYLVGFSHGSSTGIATESDATYGVPCKQHSMSPLEEQLSSQETVRRSRQVDSKENAPACAPCECTVDINEFGNAYPSEMSEFLVGTSRVDRTEFARTFDTGVPLDPSTPRNKEVLILYSHTDALPNNTVLADGTVAGPQMDVHEATENCDFLNIVLTHHNLNRQRRQCVAIVGQYESFHVQRFMRMPTQHGTPLNASLPLRAVNRSADDSGSRIIRPPTNPDTRAHWEVLSDYFVSLGSVLERLRLLLEPIAVQNTVVVLVCNHGQSELLLNFCCSAKARGLDLTPVVVFATDAETYDLAISMGFTAFYDEVNYSRIPKKAADYFGDATFAAIALAKVFCVQMVSMLEFDFLFQDVDVVWYQNPLPFFHDGQETIDPSFDIYFQHDGNHGSPIFPPYCANAGFYFVRSNDRTQHLFNTYLLSGDFVKSGHNDQTVLNSLLQEHSSMFGLRVKVLNDSDKYRLFPGGHTYQTRKEYMKGMIKGDKTPYVLHMSWTSNKGEKIKYFQQMGDWYVKDSCVAQTVTEIRLATNSTEDTALPCCLKEPHQQCHFRDKPSKIPCPDSPLFNSKAKPFW